MGIVGKIKKFFKEVSVEMKKVTWPNKEQLKESTKIVCVFCILMIIFTFAIDQAATNLINLIY